MKHVLLSLAAVLALSTGLMAKDTVVSCQSGCCKTECSCEKCDCCEKK